MKKFVYLVLFSFIFMSEAYSNNILTIFNEKKDSVLYQKASDINLTEKGLKEANKVVEKLFDELKILGPAAGLAAPQIGISKRIFLYSHNRKDMEAAINPKIIEKNGTRRTWELCFSAMDKKHGIKAALVTRSDEIKVEYYNQEGKKIRKKMDGFAAKVFQHEVDHLEGIVNVNREDAETKDFTTESEVTEFFTKIRKEDGTTYNPAIDIE